MSGYAKTNARRRRWLAGCVAAALILAAGSGQARISDESVNYHEEARAYLEKGEFNAALIQLKNAIRSDPDNVEARFDLALIYQRGGDRPFAEKELTEAYRAVRREGADRGLPPTGQVPGVSGRGGSR